MGRPLSEHELVEHAKHGNVDAYEQIVRMHQGTAFRTAYLLLGDAGEAEEATQEAFVKAHRALRRFRTGWPLRPWLLRIVANEAHNRRRSAERRARLALRTAGESRPGDAAPSPEAALLAGESREALLDAVNGLREEERLIVACRFFVDLSEAETAAVLNVPVGTVKSRLSRALERLRRELEVGRV